MPFLFLEDLLRRQDVPAANEVLTRTPGYRFPLPSQCEAMFGRDYYPAITKFVSTYANLFSLGNN